MSAQADVIGARERLLRAAVAVLGAERMLHVSTQSMTRLKAAEDEMAIAARDLTSAIGEMPPIQRPKGWTAGRDGETA